MKRGETPLAPQVWECVLPDTGEIVSLVRTEADARHVARAGRVFTLAEDAILIAALGDGVLEAKRQFLARQVTGVRCKRPLDWSRGDDIPFLGVRLCRDPWSGQGHRRSWRLRRPRGRAVAVREARRGRGVGRRGTVMVSGVVRSG